MVINLFVSREIHRSQCMYVCVRCMCVYVCVYCIFAGKTPRTTRNAARAWGVPIARTATALCSGARVRYGLYIFPTGAACINYETHKENLPRFSLENLEKEEKEIFLFFLPSLLRPRSLLSAIASLQNDSIHESLLIRPFTAALKSEEQWAKRERPFAGEPRESMRINARATYAWLKRMARSRVCLSSNRIQDSVCGTPFTSHARAFLWFRFHLIERLSSARAHRTVTIDQQYRDGRALSRRAARHTGPVYKS